MYDLFSMSCFTTICKRCKLCNKIYKNKSGLETHLDSHKPESEKIYKCETCPKSYSSQYLLNQHKIQHIPAPEGRTFKCNTCDKS